MKDGAKIKAGKPKGVHSIYNSLIGRMLIALLVVAVLCFVIFASATYRTINSIEENKIQTAMVNDIELFTDRIQDEYLSLVHISQQMLPLGSIGKTAEASIEAESVYDTYTALNDFHENMNSTAFSVVNAELIAYYNILDEGGSEIWLKNFTAKAEFDPTKLVGMTDNPDILFNPIHMAGSKFSGRKVVSIVRLVDGFSDEKPRLIYAELRTGVLDSIKSMSEAQDILYSLIQVNSNGNIAYSELDSFPVDSEFTFDNKFKNNDQMGRMNGYVWCAATTEFGFTNVLLIPASYYDREIDRLVWDLVMYSLLIVVLIVFIAYTFKRQFYEPLRHLGREMKAFSNGDMEAKEYNYSIEEYQELFERFSKMKSRINSLVEDIYKTEKEKAQLELDKLYYQINPHFMMNALNSAQWQATMKSEPELAEYLSNLNYLLGYTLGKVSQNATVNSEIQLLRAYLELQQTRQDYEFTMDIEDGLYLDRRCARLIFQPIAENAICHSIDDFGHIWVQIRELEDKSTEVIIKDDGPGFDSSILNFKDPPEIGTERQTKVGIGLRYVWLSLDSFYGGRAVMEISSKSGEGTTVRIVLPCIEEE